LAGQTDRTRTAAALLAAGHRRSEVADALGVSRPAITQRLARLEREWNVFHREPVSPGRNESDLAAQRDQSGGRRLP
jgi:predicted ArsR family transcriptional regulator